MSKTPNYDNLPIDVRVWQEQLYHNTLHKEPAPALPKDADDAAKEKYVAEIRKITDQRMAAGHDLDEVRESLGTQMSMLGEAGIRMTRELMKSTRPKIMGEEELPSSGRSPQDIVDRGHGKANIGPGTPD